MTSAERSPPSKPPIEIVGEGDGDFLGPELKVGQQAPPLAVDTAPGLGSLGRRAVNPGVTSRRSRWRLSAGLIGASRTGAEASSRAKIGSGTS